MRKRTDCTIGELLKQVRTEGNYKKGEVCKGLCSLATYTRYEENERIPRKDLLDALLQRLGIEDKGIDFIVSEKEYELCLIREQLIGGKTGYSNDIEMLMGIFREKISVNDNINWQLFYYLKSQLEESDDRRLYYIEKALDYTGLSNIYDIDYDKVLFTDMECKLIKERLFFNAKKNIKKIYELHEALEKRRITEKQMQIMLVCGIEITKIEAENDNRFNAMMYWLKSFELARHEYNLQACIDLFEIKNEHIETINHKLDLRYEQALEEIIEISNDLL